MTFNVLRYPGGKTRAISIIDKIIQEYKFDISTIISPFTGGASVELYLSYEYDSKVICNDKFKSLYLFWYYLKTNPKRLIHKINKLRPLTKEMFHTIQTKLNGGGISKLRRAAYYFAVNRSSFNGTTMSGGYSSESASKRFTSNAIRKLNSVFLCDMTFSNMDYTDFIAEQTDHNTFMFIDPPYYVDSKLYGNRGDLHDNFSHKKLRNILTSRNNWILCYNNCKYIKKLYKDVGLIIEVSWKYGMNSSKESSEIIIIRKDGTVPPKT